MSRRTQKNVGVIGLGIIGRRVADNLRRRGFHVFVWNRTPRPYPNFVGAPSELAELCDFIQIFVSDDDALLQMVQQMKRSLGPQHVVMAHSTVAPHTMRNAAEIVQRRGAHFLDAPFTGSKVPAEKGELVYYVAGDDAAYRRAKPVLEASSKEIIEIGEIGQATMVKIATNMVTAATVQAAAEALALVHHSGLAPEKFAAALRGNASNSGTLTMKLPKMIEGDFDPHFSVKHMLKDVQIAARMGRSHGLTLGATEAARDSLLEEARSGRGDADFASLIQFFFPDGLPGQKPPQVIDDDAQAQLDGLEEQATAEAARRDRVAAEARPREPEAASPASVEAPAAARDDATGAELAASATSDAATDSEDERVSDEDAISDSVPEALKEEAVDETAPPEDAVASDAPDEPAPADAVVTRDDRGDADEAEESTSAEAGTETASNGASPAPVEEADREPDTSEPTQMADRIVDAAPPSEAVVADEQPESAATDPEPEPRPAADESEREREDAESFLAGPRRTEEQEPATALATAPEPERTDNELGGEPPREHRVIRERIAEPLPAARAKEEVPERRGFLSRMFGKGSDY